MEIIVENGGTTGISNYEPLIAAVREKTSVYKGVIVTEDNIPGAKQDAAELRRIAKEASDYRIRIKKEHEAKIEQTMNQLKEITSLFNEAADAIANQVKAFEEKEKDAKQKEIIHYWTENVGDLKDLVSLEKVWDPKWLNKSVSMDAVKEAINKALRNCRDSVGMIKAMNSKHEASLLNTFFDTLDMGKVLAIKKALEDREKALAALEEQKKKIEEFRKPEEETKPVQEQKKEEQPEQVSPIQNVQKYNLKFEVTGTKEQLLSLREFMISHNIEFRKVV